MFTAVLRFSPFLLPSLDSEFTMARLTIRYFLYIQQLNTYFMAAPRLHNRATGPQIAKKLRQGILVHGPQLPIPN
jgi:hypothetical protein